MSGLRMPCRKCGAWFTTDHGMFICRPAGWDGSLCPRCNKEIEEAEQTERHTAAAAWTDMRHATNSKACAPARSSIG
jgi:hypothetical protein